MVVGTSLAIAAPKNHDTELDLNRGAKRLMIQTDAGGANYTSAGFAQVTAGNISVPATQTGVLVATFTAESHCFGAPGAWCSVRIRCDGIELQPAVGTEFAFNSVGPTSLPAAWKSLSVTRRSNVLTGGTHICEVQAASVNGAATHWLDDWTFEVEFWRQ
jgi:hypothetical protein